MLPRSVDTCLLGVVRLVVISAVAYVVQPMAVPPSRAAAKAATEGLQRQLNEMAFPEAGGSESPRRWSGASDGFGEAATAALVRERSGSANESLLEALRSVVSDSQGVMAAAAAEATCWEDTSLPAQLASALRKHTRLHIGAFA